MSTIINCYEYSEEDNSYVYVELEISGRYKIKRFCVKDITNKEIAYAYYFDKQMLISFVNNFKFWHFNKEFSDDFLLKSRSKYVYEEIPNEDEFENRCLAVLDNYLLEEAKKELTMSYKGLTQYLQSKYGRPIKSYFMKDTCKSKTRTISRADEGLRIHHIAEDRCIRLSDSECAIKYPFDYQKPDMLVYCNAFEHFLLHLLIMENNNPKDYPSLDETPSINGMLLYILPEINQRMTMSHKIVHHFYSSYIEPEQIDWSDLYPLLDIYIVLLKRLEISFNNYAKSKNPDLLFMANNGYGGKFVSKFIKERYMSKYKIEINTSKK